MNETLSPEQLIETRKSELLSYMQSFYRASWDWRATKLHEKWNKCDRNYHAVYDPEKLAKKEPWQSRMFIDITLQNVEIISSQVFKTMMAPEPPIKTEAGPAGDDLQAELISDIMKYEMQKGDFKVAFYDTYKEAVRYGSGFMKFYWEKVEDTRMRRMPVSQTPSDVVQQAPMQAIDGKAPMPQPAIQGFAMQKVPVLIKNHMKFECVHIRDVFPEPNTTKWDRVIHRNKVSYGEIAQGILAGQFFDVRAELEDLNEGEKFESDISDIKQERGYYDVPRPTSKYEKKHTIWEYWGAIPRKWIQLDIPEGDEAEVLVPAKVLVASGVALLDTRESYEYDGETPLLKVDYIRTREPYGKGICEILFDDQDEINEFSNLGIDNMNLIINKGVAVIEEALVNAEEDLEVKPGWVVRLRGSRIDNDVSKGLMPIEFPDMAQSFFKHRFDIERMVQEKTGANRVTLGTAGSTPDSNNTLGGMELSRQMFNERVAAYGMVAEASFLVKAAEKMYGLIYQEAGAQGAALLMPILGDDPILISEMPPLEVPRFMAFALVPPEEVCKSYRFKPMGIFSMENKIVKSAQIMEAIQVAGPDPRFDRIAALEYLMTTVQGIDEAKKWFIKLPMMPPMGVPPPPNGPTGGPEGNQPSFLPPESRGSMPTVQ